MTEQERKEAIKKIAERYVKNLNQMVVEEQVAYLSKLLDMFDDTRLTMMAFGVEMTPERID